MARSFPSGSPPSAYLSTGSLPVTAPPFTVGYWFKTADVTSRFLGWAAYRPSSIGYYFVGPRGDSAGDPVGAIADDGSGVANIAATSTSFTANVWHHACGVFTSASSASAYLNGGGKATATASRSPASLATMAVNRLVYNGSPLSGGVFSIAHLGIWNVALDDEDVSALASGYHPRKVCPSALVAHYAFGGFEGDNDIDRVGGYHLTPSGSPTFADQSRIIYPQGPLDVQLAASSPPAATPWLYARRSARIIGGGLS